MPKSELEREILKGVFLPDRPFGPILAPHPTNKLIFRSIYDPTTAIQKNLRKSQPFIIGRRGAGKTAFLGSFAFDEKYDICVSLQAEAAFPKMLRSIEKKIREATPDSESTIDKPNVLVEEIASLWEILLWGTVFVEIVRKYNYKSILELLPLSHYLSGMEIRQGMTLYRVMRVIFNCLAHSRTYGNIFEEVEEFASEGITFSVAKQVAVNFMKDRGLKPIILIDSLEKYPIDSISMRNAISGFLYSIGKFNEFDADCEIRCCIPSEIYTKLKHMSANALKDVENSVVLNWRTNELFHLAALRFLKFSELYYPKYFERDFSHIDISKRSGLWEFWGKILPKQVNNRIGGREYSIAYIMRHTQLLPRHLLLYMNEISARSLLSEVDGLRFSQEAIVNGIRETEPKICADIFSSYSAIYPNAEIICEHILPSLHFVFTYGDFHKIYNRNRKHVFKFGDVTSVLKMLVSIGVVGIVTKETGEYVRGTFSYNLPNELLYNPDEKFCLHPVFVEVYRVAIADFGKKPVYPFGSDPEW